ncbi:MULTISPECIES: alpha/beta hydrolase [unclassified Sphingomonas]|mgnify:CR=1 FL=1|uniref:alpha/beta fold hydrolase n=1 Tax=unclassified Sphingomonas TaxID=196159 RepID=UPI0009284F53|nr:MULTISPECIES: alpha/beta hydrolase [unclassified Sphingomonas]MBN8848642.1 alpha/beta hydrolase [Sphingomonas sp.]OJV34770.1 MAG: alpha/beta hydrolase [Sphingomonas sp. 67-36]
MTDIAANFATAEFRMSDGLVIVADVGGPPGAPTVALMHGGGQTRGSWVGAMQALLAQGYRVINFDARGHGESGWMSKGAYSLSRRAQDLGEVLQDATGPVALVGASMGGATAIYAVGEHVCDPAAVVLVDIVPQPEEEGVDRIKAFMRGNPAGFSSIEEAADAVAAYNPNRPRPTNIAGLMRNLRERDGRLFWHWDPRILEDADRDFRTQQMVAYAADLVMPTLLVRGLASDVVSDDSIARFRAVLPTLTVVDVSGAGHMVAGDRNDAFNAAAIGFLRRHMPPRK